MMHIGPAEPIPRDVAQRLCAQIMAEHRGRWWRPAEWRCWWCADMSRGDPSLMGFASSPDNRGCPFVNERWERAGRPLH